MPKAEKMIFSKGSTTYYWSSIFFPRTIRNDVFRLYSFVRIADDYVDSTPARKQEFYALRSSYQEATASSSYNIWPRANDSVNNRVIKNIIGLERTYGFDPAWVVSFLDSMQSDIEGKTYESMDDTLHYVYGSAEVIGLMMARIFGLDEAAFSSAKMLGRAMQYVNFIRDVGEDTQRGRCYFPKGTLDQFDLPDLSPATIDKFPKQYAEFIRAQIKQYKIWQHQAEPGYRYLPQPVRAPVKTAADMYNWTAEVIARDPVVAYYRQIKPHKARVVQAGAFNLLAR